jgi:hypothetical protein
MSNTADVTDGKPIAVLQSISGVNAINPLVAFYDMEERERCYSFILSRTPHEPLSQGTFEAHCVRSLLTSRQQFLLLANVKFGLHHSKFKSLTPCSFCEPGNSRTSCMHLSIYSGISLSNLIPARDGNANVEMDVWSD